LWKQFYIEEEIIDYNPEANPELDLKEEIIDKLWDPRSQSSTKKLVYRQRSLSDIHRILFRVILPPVYLCFNQLTKLKEDHLPLTVEQLTICSLL
jgi:hypothetical protein